MQKKYAMTAIHTKWAMLSLNASVQSDMKAVQKYPGQHF
jgi:hypothetical protein